MKISLEVTGTVLPFVILVVNMIQPVQTPLLKCGTNAFWKAGKVSHLGDFCLCLLCFIHYLSASVFKHCLNAFYPSPRDALARNALFRQRCNKFFIDVVTTMCFKDNEPPEAEVTQELLNLLFVHRNLLKGSGELPCPDAQVTELTLLLFSLTCQSCLFLISTDHPAIYTKLLSPFNDEVDETPVIRSVMLKLLLKYR